MRSRLPADHADEHVVRLAEELQLLSVLLALAVHFDRFGGWGAGAQRLKVLQLGHQVLHQVVLGEGLLAEHLGQGQRQTVTQ